MPIINLDRRHFPVLALPASDLSLPASYRRSNNDQVHFLKHRVAPSAVAVTLSTPAQSDVRASVDHEHWRKPKGVANLSPQLPSLPSLQVLRPAVLVSGTPSGNGITANAVFDVTNLDHNAVPND
jgi:hypothetical protein